MIWTGLDIATAVTEALAKRPSSQSIYFLCSTDTESLCHELIHTAELGVDPKHIFTVPNGEIAKNLHTAETIFQWLQGSGAMRNALLINVGGGALCDVGGFCAATYMRGITYWNIPTTLLAMVDASVGGKNGINLGHHKNYIGTFQQPERVFVSPHWLQTLPHTELLSGWAEVIKHGVLSGGKQFQQILKPIPAVTDHQTWSGILTWNIKVKSRIVEADFTEQGERKLLNLGHTIGHALESWSHDQQSPIAHGNAVAWGLVLETALACTCAEAPQETEALYHSLKQLVQSMYPPIKYGNMDIPSLIDYIRADKKNQDESLLFSLAFTPGNCKYNCEISAETVVQILQDHVDDGH